MTPTQPTCPACLSHKALYLGAHGTHSAFRCRCCGYTWGEVVDLEPDHDDEPADWTNERD